MGKENHRTIICGEQNSTRSDIERRQQAFLSSGLRLLVSVWQVSLVIKDRAFYRKNKQAEKTIVINDSMMAL